MTIALHYRSYSRCRPAWTMLPLTTPAVAPPPTEATAGTGNIGQGQVHRLNIFVLVQILFHYLEKVDLRLLVQAKEVSALFLPPQCLRYPLGLTAVRRPRHTSPLTTIVWRVSYRRFRWLWLGSAIQLWLLRLGLSLKTTTNLFPLVPSVLSIGSEGVRQAQEGRQPRIPTLGGLHPDEDTTMRRRRSLGQGPHDPEAISQEQAKADEASHV